MDNKALIQQTKAWLIAIEKGDEHAVRSFIEEGIDVNRANQEGICALMRAAFHGNTPLVQLLLAAGANPNATDINQNTPFWYAVNKGRLDTTEALLAKGADPNQTNIYGTGALHEAARKGHLDLLRLLLEKGAEPNIREQNGYTPLMLGTKRYSVVKALIEADADVNQKGNDGATALIKASHRAKPPVLAALIEAGAGINSTDASGESPLSVAAASGREEICSMLLENGADIDIRNGEGTTPLMLAIRNGHFDLAQMLIEKGAEVCANNLSGRTVLMDAAHAGSQTLMEICISRGADVNQRSNTGDTVLLMEAFDGKKPIFEMLLSNGADINARNKEGRSVLIAAVQGGEVDRVQRLLEAGADLSAKDTAGKTAVDYAQNKVMKAMLYQTAAGKSADEPSNAPPSVPKELQQRLLALLKETGPGIGLDIFEVAGHLDVDKPEIVEQCALSLADEGIRLMGEVGVGRPVITLVPEEARQAVTAPSTSPRGAKDNIQPKSDKSSKDAQSIIARTSVDLTPRSPKPRSSSAPAVGTSLETVTLVQILGALAHMVEHGNMDPREKWPLVEKIMAITANQTIQPWLTTPLKDLLDF